MLTLAQPRADPLPAAWRCRCGEKGAAMPSVTQAVYCRRCDNPRPLAVVAPGTLILKHQGSDRTITGLTAAQQVWAKCPRCQCQQEIVIPQEGGDRG